MESIRTTLTILGLLAAAGCARSPIFDGPTLGDDPGLLGDNLTPEIERGEFFVGHGDLVQVEVWNQPDLRRTYRVSPEGTIYPFLVGEVDAGGLTIEELRSRLAAAYEHYYVNPSLDIHVQFSPMRKVTVAGSVIKPGIYPLEHPRFTVVDMIALSGGVAAEGDTTGVVVARRVEGKWQVVPYSLDALFEPKNPEIRQEIPFVHPGDQVYVVRTAFSQFDERMRVVTETLRAINFAERAILLAPQTAEALDF